MNWLINKAASNSNDLAGDQITFVLSNRLKFAYESCINRQ